MTTQNASTNVTSALGKLQTAALRVLRGNDLGRSTKPAPQLYPHQWSWDSAFIAIGLAYHDLDRALVELETLFQSQWKDGRVPHIVFNPDAVDYFPGPQRWACSDVSDAAPSDPHTSGLIQPPVHALAAWRICELDIASGEKLQSRLRDLYPKLMSWHRYLATGRDPEGMGLVSIYHPWESGTDNSPRWDVPLSAVKVGEIPLYTRRDTKHVADASERPTQAEYDRYLWLVECLKKCRYEDERINKDHPFIIKDALMSAIFAAANRALQRLSSHLGMPDSDRKQLQSWEERTRQGISKHSWDEKTRLALDNDMRQGGTKIVVSTCAGLCPILIPEFNDGLATICERIMGGDFAGHQGFKFAVVPSTTPGTPGYKERAYWRGPSWPVINWLYWHAMREHGFTRQAERLRQGNLDLLLEPEAKFGEYFQCSSGQQLGSADQSWTAAVAIDWIESRSR